jgi:DNA-binding MarR family transcriptional regulator
MDSTSTSVPITRTEALTELMLEVFRLNGRLLTSGDRLVADIGLTSARWQVLGAIFLAGNRLPVAHIARNMGLTRQAVQRIVNELAVAGLVNFAPNPYHRRAHLVVFTAQGSDAYRAAMDRQAPWANQLADALDERDIRLATRVLRTLVQRLDPSVADASQPTPSINKGESDRGPTDRNGSQRESGRTVEGRRRTGAAGEQVRRRR